MPKANFKLSPAMNDILWAYVRGEIDEDDVSSEIDQLAFYQRDVQQGVDAYYLGID